MDQILDVQSLSDIKCSPPKRELAEWKKQNKTEANMGLSLLISF